MEQEKLAPNNIEGYARFGHSVSISGDYAIVGASEDDGAGSDAGAVFIFHRTSHSTWDPGTKIVSPDAQDEAYFGHSVSISGDYALVGAHKEDSASFEDSGAAYFFRRTGTNSWILNHKIILERRGKGVEFANSVSISGDYALIGNSRYVLWGPNQGIVYAYQRTQQDLWRKWGHNLQDESAPEDAFFSHSTSLWGEHAIVGEPYRTNGGAAYIFKRTAQSFELRENLWPSGLSVQDSFGISVAISDAYAVVGNVQTGIQAENSVFVYRRTGDNEWNDFTVIDDPGTNEFSGFGASVAISGDIIAVGDPADSTEGPSTGAVYLYKCTGDNTWDEGTKITAYDAPQSACFGSSVAIEGMSLIIGDSCDGSGGSAYAY